MPDEHVSINVGLRYQLNRPTRGAVRNSHQGRRSKRIPQERWGVRGSQPTAHHHHRL